MPTGPQKPKSTKKPRSKRWGSEALIQWLAVGAQGGEPWLRENVPRTFGPREPRATGSSDSPKLNEEGFLRLIRFDPRNRKVFFRHQQQFSLDEPVLTTPSAAYRVNGQILASLGRTYRTCKHILSILNLTANNTVLLRAVVRIVAVAGIAYRRQDKEILIELSELSTQYLSDLGAIPSKRADAVKLYHSEVQDLVNRVCKRLSPDNSRESARSLSRLMFVLLRQTKLTALRDALPRDGRIALNEAEVAAVQFEEFALNVLEQVPRNPSDATIADVSRALIREAMRQLGMPRAQANSLFDFERKKGRAKAQTGSTTD